MSKRRHFRRIGIALLVLILSVAFLCLVSTSPSISPETAFRRKEKENLIGPAEIFAKVDFRNGTYDHILIGKSVYGYTFFECRDASLDKGRMTYVPKQKGATLYCTYYRYGSEHYSQDWLPIFAFVDTPVAHTARLVLTTTNKDGETINHPLASQRNQQGYFLFHWHTLDLQQEEFWLVQQLIAGQHDEYVLDGTVQATLELYDRNDTLLETYHFQK